MKKTLRFIYSISVFMTMAICLQAQQERVRGPRIGYDLAGLAQMYFHPERRSHTFSADFEIKQDYYPVIEIGWQNVEIERENYTYLSDGVMIRMGLDRNLFKYSNPRNYDMGFASLRYGFASLEHEARNIRIGESYWGDLSDGEIDSRTLHTHWISIGGGLRAEVFHNFFIGWSGFASFRLYRDRDRNMEPYYIPGFGKGSRKLGLTIQYSVYYRIPVSRFP